MKTLLKYTFSILFMIIINSESLADVVAKVDRQKLYEGEAVSLTLTLTGDEQDELPEWAPLRKDFDLGSTSSKSMMAFNNGNYSSSKELSILLFPKAIGKLTIPSIKVGNKNSQTIDIEILSQQSQKSAGKQADVFIEVETDIKEAYVQQQIIYTVKIFHAVSFQQGTISKPESNDIVVEKIGDDKTYEVFKDGKRYAVFEQKFSLFAQTSGAINIPALTFQGSYIVPNQNKQRDSFFGGGLFNQLAQARPIQLQSKSLALNILPVPTQMQQHWWLPAKHFTIQEQWSAPSNTIVAGEPVTRTITMRAEGLGGNQLPELAALTTKNIKSYPDQADIQTLTQNNTLMGIRQEKMAIVANQAGQFTLPEIIVHWWDITENKAKQAKLPSRTLTVTADPARQKPITVLDDNTAENNKSDEPTNSAPIMVTQSETNHILLISNVVLAIALLISWYFLFIKLRQNKIQTNKPEHQEISPKQAFREFQKACKTNQAKLIKQTLINWAQLYWQQPHPSLLWIADQIEEPSLKNAITALDGNLYSNHQQDITMQELAKSLAQWVAKNSANNKQNKAASSLAELNPN